MNEDMAQQSVTPKPLATVMRAIEAQMAAGDTARFQPLATGFSPLDEVVNGGLRQGELLIVGGAFGVGKTIFSLQVARNVVAHHGDAVAMYVCYEHDEVHLMSRLLCMESAEMGQRDRALTMRQLGELTQQEGANWGLINQLRAIPLYAPVVDAMTRYADRLLLVKASGSQTTLEQIGAWAGELADAGRQGLLVVDYLQKIPVNHAALQPETEVTTHITQSLKEMAMTTGIRVLAIAAADRDGLKSPRMRLADLRGSSAIQYEADVGLVFNNKFAVVSREHMVYNPTNADAMRNWVVMSIEKNRAGRAAVDMEYTLDAAHFRMISNGDFVRDRLIDDRLTLS